MPIEYQASVRDARGGAHQAPRRAAEGGGRVLPSARGSSRSARDRLVRSRDDHARERRRGRRPPRVRRQRPSLRDASTRARRRRSSSTCTAATTPRVVIGSRAAEHSRPHHRRERHQHASSIRRRLADSRTSRACTIRAQSPACRTVRTRCSTGGPGKHGTERSRHPGATSVRRTRRASESATTVASASRRESASPMYTYGFDQRPYESMVTIEGEYATAFRGARVSGRGGSAIGIVANPLHGHRESVRFRVHQLQRLRKRDRRLRRLRIHTSRCISGSGCFIPRSRSRSDRRRTSRSGP